MLDGLWKERQDHLWERVARPLAWLGVSANQVTFASTILVFAFAAAYAWHENSLYFGVGLALAELLDNVDGALARVTGTQTRFGAYLDAVTDRYKEFFAFGAVAYVTGEWALCFASLAGSMLTSYNKARAGMEIPIDNARWPDLFERFERLAVLVAGLVLSPFLPSIVHGRNALSVALIVIASLSMLSSIQRFWRARRLFSERAAAERAR